MSTTEDYSQRSAAATATVLPQEVPQQPWRQSWLEADARLRSSASAVVTHTVVSRNARVNKLDADLLDDELADMLREPVSKAMSLLRPGLVETYRLEVDTAIRALLFWLSVGSHRRATYGQALQNLTYAGAKKLSWRIHAFGLASIGGGYAWARAMQHMSRCGWANAPWQSLRNRIWRMAGWLERAAKVAALANLLAFFAAGQYKSVLERVLGLRLVSARPQMAQSVSFEFLNRQLVWHAFTEFVMFALPLLKPARARAWAVRNVRAVLRLPPAAVDPVIEKLPENVCAICFSTAAADSSVPVEPSSCLVSNPYIADCGHSYCYVCIKTRLMVEGSECSCLRCGHKVESICQHAEIRDANGDI
ncbi:peroxisome assembly protein (Peroxin-2) [Kickxella alabastrina]|uniref:Peroxisome assembly protein (Peroxin-2) n=1 Tax=Kickxella alabastrina TaxID=61397 RepID=A0ACC1IUH8_9FUNG|nr:peroxisome assembly protein (Peroxin-2) [Kickxella alabastrina]